MRSRIRPLVLSLAIVASTITLDIAVIQRVTRNHTAIPQSESLPAYTAERLKNYDGTDPDKPVLLAYDGYVYDVSAGRADFYDPGKPYHDLAGKDSSLLLHIAGGNIIARKYPIVGKYN